MTTERTIYYRAGGNSNRHHQEIDEIKMKAELEFYKKLAIDRGYILEGIIECINGGDVASLSMGSQTAVMTKYVKPETNDRAIAQKA
jgi:hypothetical protein